MSTQKTLRDSAGLRWTALLLLALAMFCAYIFMDILSPIKDLMQTQRGWDSDAFGTMQGAETFLNVFVFFLIFAGIILDKMGVRFTALLSGAVMLVGAIIKWYAISDSFIGSSVETWFTENLNHIPVFEQLGVSPFYEGMPASAKLAALGFMLFGCGAEMGGITVSRGIVKWFKGREMALAMGSEMALARLGVATCMIFSPFFAKLGGDIDVSRSVAFGVVLLCIALIMLVVYFFMDKKLDAQTGEAEEKDDPFKISDLGQILTSGFLARVPALCALLLCHIPIPEICREHAPVQPDVHRGSCGLFLGFIFCHYRSVSHHARCCCYGVHIQLHEEQWSKILHARLLCHRTHIVLLHGIYEAVGRVHIRCVPAPGRRYHTCTWQLCGPQG